MSNLEKTLFQLKQGNNDESKSLNLLRLASRLDAVGSRVETTVTMRQVTSVVKGMDKAMETMNLERISLFSDLDVQTSYMEDAMGSTTAVSTPQDQKASVAGEEDESLANRLRSLRPAT
ncbi:hypothetical protein V8E53_004770 [Lactarius tabidus]